MGAALKRHREPAGRWSDLPSYWPVPLIGVSVALIRFEGVWAQIGIWMWVPVAVVMGVGLLRRGGELRPGAPTALLGSFAALQLVSVLWSPAPRRGLWLAALTVTSLLGYLYGAVHGPPPARSPLWRHAVTSGALAAAALVLIPDPSLLAGLNPDRLLAMGVVALTVFAWYGPRPRHHILLTGALALTLVVASGSRMASLVVALLIVSAPGLRLPAVGRALLAGILLSMFALASTTATFQERWFVSGEGTLLELVSPDQLQTSGRLQVWSSVADSCRSPIFGEGAGAADTFAERANSGFPEPHNEYLRVWCDTGLVGTALFWGLLGTVVVTAGKRPLGRRRAWAGHTTLQLAAALALLSVTDNPLTTGVIFMIPVALVLGWSQHESATSGALTEAGDSRTTGP